MAVRLRTVAESGFEQGALRKFKRLCDATAELVRPARAKDVLDCRAHQLPRKRERVGAVCSHRRSRRPVRWRLEQLVFGAEGLAESPPVGDSVGPPALFGVPVAARARSPRRLDRGVQQFVDVRAHLVRKQIVLVL